MNLSLKIFYIYPLYIQSLFTEYISPWPYLGQCAVALSREITIYGRSVIAGVRVGEAKDIYLNLRVCSDANATAGVVLGLGVDGISKRPNTAIR